MLFSTAGSYPRFDISLLVGAIGPLRAEWEALRFDAAGNLLNPVTGESTDVLRLVDGVHRSPGARYETVVRTPVTAADPDRLRALDAEMLGAADVDWAEYGRRVVEITTPTGEVTEARNQFTLRADDARTLGVTVADPQELWSADIDIVHGRIPRFELSGRVEATAMMIAEGVPGFVARRIGGTGTATAVIDPVMIERAGGGTIAQGAGQLNRFSAEGSATVRTTPRSWDVEGSLDLRGRGLGRLVLWFLRRRLSTAVSTSLEAYWRGVPSLDDGTELDRQLRRIAEAVEKEGGTAPVLHRLLWEKGYAEHLTATYDLE